MFEYDPVSRFPLLTQADLIEDLSAGLGAKVDLIVMEGLHPSFRNRIARDMVRVF